MDKKGILMDPFPIHQMGVRGRTLNGEPPQGGESSHPLMPPTERRVPIKAYQSR